MATDQASPVQSGSAGTTPSRPALNAYLPLFAHIAPAIAAVLLLLSLALPYWSLTLHAPQYPGGLDATIFTTHLTGDVDEIDELNHYIGMMKLGDAARMERGIAPLAIVAMAVLGFLAVIIRSRWALILTLPIVGFPILFVVDLYYWLYRAGHELDPRAALSSSVQPFTPHLLGTGMVGQFSTTAQFEAGFYLCLLAALIVVAGGYLRLRRGEG